MESSSPSDTGVLSKPCSSINSEAVKEALLSLKHVSGSTVKDLKKFFMAKEDYGSIPQAKLTSQLKRSLRKGMLDGKVEKAGRSKFILATNKSHECEDDQGSKKKRVARRVDSDDESLSRKGRRRRRHSRRRRRSSSRRRRRRSSRRRRRRSSRRRRSRRRRSRARRSRRRRRHSRRRRRRSRRRMGRRLKKH